MQESSKQIQRLDSRPAAAGFSLRNHFGLRWDVGAGALPSGSRSNGQGDTPTVRAAGDNNASTSVDQMFGAEPYGITENDFLLVHAYHFVPSRL